MNRRLGICLVVILMSSPELWAQQKTQCERDAVYANKNMVDYELKAKTMISGVAIGPFKMGEISEACIAVFDDSPDHRLVRVVTADSEGKFNLALIKGTYRLVAWDPQNKAFRVANAVVKVRSKAKKSKPTEIVVRFAVSGIDSGSWIELKK